MSDAVHLFTSNSSVTEKIFNASREAQSKRRSNSFASTVLIPADPLERGEGGRIGPGNGGRTNQSLPWRKMGGEGGTEFGEIDAGGEERSGERMGGGKSGKDQERRGRKTGGGWRVVMRGEEGWMYVCNGTGGREREREKFGRIRIYLSLCLTPHTLSRSRFGL